MSEKKSGLTVFICAVALVLSVSVFGQKNVSQQKSSVAKSISCVNCHKTLGGELTKPVTEWTGSIHYQNGITCNMCHGGDPTATTMEKAMSKDHGFIGAPHGQAQFDACAKCHATEVSMYAKSVMGKAYLEGKGGPSCAKCHGPHHNVIPEVPQLCKSCHKDTTGFDQIDPMNVTPSTVQTLSKMKIKLGEQKVSGTRPAAAPKISEDLDPYKIGLVAFGGSIFVFILGYIIYLILEKRD